MRLLLVDGHYYAYRSFFAIRGLTNSGGDPTNAVFGFFKALRKMLADVQPDAAAVIWDAGLPERRMELLPSYKQHRDETPGDLEVQFPVIEEAVHALGLQNIRLQGEEADDLIASYATAAGVSNEVVIATNDKDIFAVVSERVSIYTTNKVDTAKGREGFALLGPGQVEAKWGVPPGLIPDVLALTGDAADNIPGIEGVGPKTAAKLVREYGRVLDLIDHPEMIKNEKLRAKVAGDTARLRANLELVRLDHDLPLPTPLEDLAVVPDIGAVTALARKCEFRGLLAEYEKLSVAAISPAQGELF